MFTLDTMIFLRYILPSFSILSLSWASHSVGTSNSSSSNVLCECQKWWPSGTAKQHTAEQRHGQWGVGTGDSSTFFELALQASPFMRFYFNVSTLVVVVVAVVVVQCRSKKGSRIIMALGRRHGGGRSGLALAPEITLEEEGGRITKQHIQHCCAML